MTEFEPIAIVSLSCRFPGAPDEEAFWRLLYQGEDAVKAGYDDRRLNVAGASGDKWVGRLRALKGGFLEDIDAFDASAFNISAREARMMDPQQRIMLETAWEALDGAGQDMRKLTGRRVGVYIGVYGTDYQTRSFCHFPEIDISMTTGVGAYALAGRISYAFGFQGPSLTVETACSSSLVAVHLACQALRQGECELALAGGVNLLLDPAITLAYLNAGALAPDSRCKFGDAAANGYVRSEGAAIIALKPLQRAIADGDTIRAVIRSSVVSHAGQSGSSLYAPGEAAQISLFEEALARAGIAAVDLDYIEAHGSGTPVGDRVELTALGATLRTGPGGRAAPCLVGSVKTNIGHTEAAAGVAGLIKTLLCLQHGEVPPNLHFRAPNPEVTWDDRLFRIPTRLTPIGGANRPALAAVHSLGITGTTACVVLEAAPEQSAAFARASKGPEAPIVLPLSARSTTALSGYAGAVSAQLRSGEVAAEDIAFSAARRRTHHDHRLTVIGRSAEELADALDGFGQGEFQANLRLSRAGVVAAPKVGWVFCGQGSQWVGMGMGLYAAEPVYRAKMDELDALITADAGFSVIEEIRSESNPGRLDRTDVTQPALFAVQVSLATLLISWGLRPSMIVGHSVGEVAAALMAGVLTQEDAVRVICARGRITEKAAGWGKMAAFEIGIEEAEKMAGDSAGRLNIAAVNGPTSITMAGLPGPLIEACERIAAEGRFARLLDVDYPSHCALLDPLFPEMASVSAKVGAKPPETLLYSTVLGRRAECRDFDPEYWARNLRDAVLFAPAVAAMAQAGCDLFIEIGPHPVLCYSIRQTLEACGSVAAVVEAMRRDTDDVETIRQLACEHYVRGSDPDWSALAPVDGLAVSLPAYPWDRERYWVEEMPRTGAWRNADAAPTHPLLQHRLDILGGDGTVYWQSEISLARFPWITDHRVRSQATFPAAGYIVAAQAAADALSPGSSLSDIEFHEALLVPEAGFVRLQFGFSADGRWVVEAALPDHAHSARMHVSGGFSAEKDRVDPGRFSSPLSGKATGQAAFYAAMTRAQLHYGALFRGVESLEVSGSTAWARLAPVPNDTATDGLHPATVDACLQTLLALTPGWGEVDDLWLPQAVKRVRWRAGVKPGHGLTAVAVGIPSLLEHDFMGDVLLLDSRGDVQMSLEGVRLHKVSAAASIPDLLHEVRWILQPRATAAGDGATTKPWLLLADAGSVAVKLAQRLVDLGQPCTLGDGAAVAAYLAGADEAGQVVVDLRPLDARLADDDDAEALTRIETLALGLTLETLHRLVDCGRHHPPRFVIVTGGSQATGDDQGPVAMLQSTLWALARNAALENTGTPIAAIDLDMLIDEDAIASLAAELVAGHGEPEVALRRGRRRVRRLVRANQFDPDLRPLPAGAHQLTISRRGALDGFAAVPANPEPPKPDEVQICTVAAGVNFHDLLSLLGVIPSPHLGMECAGMVSAIGRDVVGIGIGDEVVAASLGTWQSHVNAPALLVAAKPKNLTHAQAAGLPIVYLTAAYALRRLIQLRPGQRVLIHAAAGGFGLAALNVCLAAGAEVLTTAGTVAKREFLREAGAMAALDSRSLQFADDIRRIGDGKVDVIVNSLTGAFIPASLDLLAAGGAFIEVGKRGIWTGDELARRRPDVTYHIVDLEELMRDSPQTLDSLLSGIVADVERGVLHALPIRAFPISQAVSALRFMQEARQTGKIVLSLPPAVDPLAAETPPSPGAILVTGGLGGLGLAVTRRLADKGQRQFILTGRSAPGDAAVAMIEQLRSAGVEVWTERCDLGVHADVARLIARCGHDLPPLKGVFHLAGVLDDAPVHQLDTTRFLSVYRPKVLGAWSLHRLTETLPLEHFVCFSSWTAVLGSPGQANYASANAFLDALAHHRRARGLVAQSINWGGWRATGIATDSVSVAHLKRQGLDAMATEMALDALEQVLSSDAVQVAVSPFDPDAWRAFAGAWAGVCAVSELLSPDPDAEHEPVAESAAPAARELPLRAALTELPAGALRRNLLELRIQARLSQVLRTPVKALFVHKPFKSLGLDSLTALEMRNALEVDTELKLPATLIFNHASISKLATKLAELLGVPLDAAPVAPVPDAAVSDDITDLFEALQALPEEERLRLLSGDR